MERKILVVGSSNTDMVLKTARFPKAGEKIIKQSTRGIRY
jgi:sugar/nucleoside kinase (ribokinase family)